MSVTLNLYRLQQVDSQIDKIQKRLDAIQRILDDNAELQRAKTHLAQVEEEHQETSHSLRQAETKVKNQQIKIEQTESMLYSGSVKNPKEVQDLQNKAISLKNYLVTLEDRQLEAMLANEETGESREASQSALDDLKARLLQQNSELAGEQTVLNNNKERLATERQAILPSIQTDALAQYDKLRQTKRGVAIAAVNDGCCAACGATLPPSRQQAARSTAQLTYCPSCKRILYGS